MYLWLYEQRPKDFVTRVRGVLEDVARVTR